MRALAFLISLVAPGSGHALTGHVRRGFVWAVGLLAFAFLGPVVLPITFASVVLMVILRLAGVLVCAFDATRVRGPRPPWGMLAMVLTVLVVGGWIASDAARTHMRRYFQAFTIPSGSMQPTLLVGDYILVDKAVYRGRPPRRGDIVVHRYLDGPRTFVKRVVAVPGETIHLRGREVLIDGRALDEPYVKLLLGASPGACMFAYGCEPTVIPPGRYFVLSDNRDNGQDSRHYGPVAEDAIFGRVFSIYWSWDGERHWLRHWRVGKTIY